jgi:hypothetical protein
MDKGDRNRPFADCRRHALEAASADVADREHPRQTRFQEIRGPGKRPICHGQIILRQIRPRFPEETISWAQLWSRMAALINRQLLSEGEVLQSQTLTVLNA